MKDFQDFELTQDEQRNAIGKGKPAHAPGRPGEKGLKPWERLEQDKAEWDATRPEDDADVEEEQEDED